MCLSLTTLKQSLGPVLDFIKNKPSGTLTDGNPLDHLWIYDDLLDCLFLVVYSIELSM